VTVKNKGDFSFNILLYRYIINLRCLILTLLC